MNKKQIHTTICDLYELDGVPNKASLRKLINRHLKEEYPNKTWDELTLLEQHIFTHILITEAIFDNYVQDDIKQKKISRKIQKESKEMSLDIDVKLKEQNEINEKIMKQYYVENDTEQGKKEAYRQLCEDYKAIIKEGTPQTYEEWTKTPLRLYDYIMSRSLETAQESIDEEMSVLPERINDTIIKTILKILKVEFEIEIDIQRITDCLTFLYNFEPGNEFEELLFEYDPALPLSKEAQQEIISMNKQFQLYTDMLDKLDFFHKKEKA